MYLKIDVLVAQAHFKLTLLKRRTLVNTNYTKRHQTTSFLLSQSSFANLSHRQFNYNVPCLPLIVMVLPKDWITWNRLYAAQPLKRLFCERRILSHYLRMRLSRRGVKKAAVRYEFCTLRFCSFNTYQFLQTDGLAWGEWHRRSWWPYRC